MQLVQEVVEELLAILMVVPSELRIFLQDKQYILWLKLPPPRSIEVLDELSKGTRHVSFTAQHIRHIQILQMLVLEEEISKVH
jgi:hypothetical protein